MAAGGFDLNKLKNIKLTKEQQQYIAVAVLLVGGGGYGYWNFLMVPLNKNIVTLEKQVQEKKDNLEKARRIKSQWEEYNQRLSRVQAGNAFVTRRLPPSKGLDLGITRLIRMATEGGISLVRYAGDNDATRNKSEYDGYKKTVLNVLFVGDFHKLGEFLSRLSGEDLIYLYDEIVMLGTPRVFQETQHITSGFQFKLINYSEIVPETK